MIVLVPLDGAHAIGSYHHGKSPQQIAAYIRVRLSAISFILSFDLP